MSPLFGKDLCEQFIGLEILSMGEDLELKVRKAAVYGMPIVAKMVTDQFLEQRFLQLFLKLSKDP